MTTTDMNADNTTGAVIGIVLGGTNIPLPNNQILNNFTVDGTNTIFTVTETGTYLVSYHVALTVAVLLTSGVSVNGTLAPSSVLTPLLSVSQYNNTFLLNLTAGDQLSLQLSGLLGAVVLQAGSGAGLSLVRVV
jgi:hypothetical protein